MLKRHPAHSTTHLLILQVHGTPNCPALKPHLILTWAELQDFLCFFRISQFLHVGLFARNRYYPYGWPCNQPPLSYRYTQRYIYIQSRGLFRMLNIECTTSLFGAYLYGQTKCTQAVQCRLQYSLFGCQATSPETLITFQYKLLHLNHRNWGSKTAYELLLGQWTQHVRQCVHSFHPDTYSLQLPVMPGQSSSAPVLQYMYVSMVLHTASLPTVMIHLFTSPHGACILTIYLYIGLI